MPTGYTSGILDGTIKDFNEFAKLCSRAFTIHLRDEPMNSEYKKREPSDYHLKAINEAKVKLKEAKLMTDEEIVTQKTSALISNKKYHLKGGVKQKANKVKIESFLSKAKEYSPPTEKHKGIAKFMVEQLEKTIDFDCKGSYHADELATIDAQIESVNADSVRSEIKAEATNDIIYHTKEYDKELKACISHNKWYEDFINSLNE